MLVLTFHYKQGIPFDEAYYLNTHVALLSKKTVLEMGATKYEVKKVLSSADGTTPRYSFIFSLYFETKEALESFISNPVVQELKDDVANYYVGEQDIYIEEVVASFQGE
ncbi:hypothetical protein PAECIP111891_02820 [Paenibacillus allorhizoplanae]|uniref:EthD domain-containing protein n=1 Tax=Paenibacillus allorhizoplanae TaxID=2905648 RepID=A0ABM9C9Q4_9BACL|nr:EthD family reductase [Paenibacillus allorhizoplanae]CAH1206192.1 hypothetical protein PAECIP111891_02820 [Paenibacillus allorhizoplanae]